MVSVHARSADHDHCFSCAQLGVNCLFCHGPSCCLPYISMYRLKLIFENVNLMYTPQQTFYSLSIESAAVRPGSRCKPSSPMVLPGASQRRWEWPSLQEHLRSGFQHPFFHTLPHIFGSASYLFIYLKFQIFKQHFYCEQGSAAEK